MKNFEVFMDGVDLNLSFGGCRLWMIWVLWFFFRCEIVDLMRKIRVYS